MKRSLLFSIVVVAYGCVLLAAEPDFIEERIEDGALRGVLSADGEVRSFRGIPYAAPPIGELRWKAPQAVEPWAGVRDATSFGPRAMQEHIWDDMRFFDDGPSEDCLYLNVWAPTNAGDKKLPVMYWIHGGGLRAGATSEPRQDGRNLAKKGVVVVSVGYRMSVFGFMAHPELTAESPEKASGNYGLLDMVAGLEWVQRNIGSFGGDAGNVTIFGESAGATAVSSLVASPLTEGLFHKAIAQSGSIVGIRRSTPSLSEAEQMAETFIEQRLEGRSLEKMRELSGDELLKISWAEGAPRFHVCVDGYFFPKSADEIFAEGGQRQVPLIAGWNLDESGLYGWFGGQSATLENYVAKAEELFGEKAEAFLAAYSASNDAEAIRAATDFRSDVFKGYETWSLAERHSHTGNSPVYRYRFDQTLPLPNDAAEGETPRAAHSWEIEYVFDVLASKDLPWRDSDWKVAEQMSSYWVNFAKTGDPNGTELPEWPPYNEGSSHPVLHIDESTSVELDTHRARYEFLGSLSVD